MIEKPMPFPDEHQQKVIDHRGCPLVVVAGPGSGKTRTLVERARTILAAAPESTVSFVTFTRTSRRDTKKKLESVLTTEEETRNQDFPTVSTLHGFAKSIVHRAAAVVGLDRDFDVLVPEKEQSFLLEEVIQDLSLGVSNTALRDAIARLKNTGNPGAVSGMTPEEFGRAADRYEQLCRFYNAIDIEGLVNAATTIVTTGAVGLPALFFHADEFQDLNESDQQLVQALLAAGLQDVVVVGDDDQSIYGRRQAKPEGIRELFANPRWEKVSFKQSHRLPPHILRASQALIKIHRGPRLDKGIAIPADDGRRVPAFICTTDGIELELIASLIGQHLAKEDGEQKLSYKDFMVLCPTRAIANSFAKQLQEKAAIPVKKIAAKTIPEDLWRILLLLRLVRGDNALALRQWLEVLNIPQGEIIQMRDLALAQGQTLFEVARRSTNKAIQDFFCELEALRSARDDFSVLLNKIKFVAGAPELPWTTQAESLPALLTELYEEYGLLDAEEEEAESDEVLVTTLHSSKGLEAEIVFIIQLSDRYMPNPARDPDEELRVLYVGMTRAKRELYLSCSYVYDPQTKRKRPSMSPFLRPIAGHLRVQQIMRAKPKRQRKN